MPRGNTLITCVLLLTALFAANSFAATLQVPSEYVTIERALQSARNGDRVLLQPGVYQEHGLTLPAGVVLAGVDDDPSATVIDGMGRGRILEATDGETVSRVLNLTFRQGLALGVSTFEQSGAAIFAGHATIEIINCVFEANWAGSHGGAIRLVACDATVRDCSFVSNTALIGGGGGIDCSYGTEALIQDCDFEQNKAAWGGALAVRGESKPEILRGAFYGNHSDGGLAYGGGAVVFYESEADFRYCTFYGNQSDFGGAAASLPGSPVRFEHCTMVQNTAADGAGLFSRGAALSLESSIVVFQDGPGVTAEGDAEVQIRCSNLHGNSGGEVQGIAADVLAVDQNLSVDPLFCEMDDSGLSFNVDVYSPCATNTSCGTIGAWMTGCSGTRGVQTMSPAPRVLTITGLQASPNPFNPSTRIRFELQSEQRVRAEVFSIDGRRVRSLADRDFTAGWNVLPWNGQDDSGRSVGSGAYIVRLQGEAVTTTQKVLLLK